MTVYILFDDCPEEFSEKSILAVYSNRKSAYKALEKKRKSNPYMYQYTIILPMRVR